MAGHYPAYEAVRTMCHEFPLPGRVAAAKFDLDQERGTRCARNGDASRSAVIPPTLYALASRLDAPTLRTG
jgi:hypothetical protein